MQQPRNQCGKNFDAQTIENAPKLTILVMLAAKWLRVLFQQLKGAFSVIEIVFCLIGNAIKESTHSHWPHPFAIALAALAAALSWSGAAGA